MARQGRQGGVYTAPSTNTGRMQRHVRLLASPLRHAYLYPGSDSPLSVWTNLDTHALPP